MQKYLSMVVSKFPHCISSSLPPPARKLLLGPLDRSFNDVVAVDHFYLYKLCMFHSIDTVTRYYPSGIALTATISDATEVLQACWFTQFWQPLQIHGDKAFNASEFLTF